MKPKNEYLTPAEVSDRWRGRVSVGTLANWRNLGRGPVYTKLEGTILYPLAEIVKFEKRNMIKP